MWKVSERLQLVAACARTRVGQRVIASGQGRPFPVACVPEPCTSLPNVTFVLRYHVTDRSDGRRHLARRERVERVRVDGRHFTSVTLGWTRAQDSAPRYHPTWTLSNGLG